MGGFLSLGEKEEKKISVHKESHSWRVGGLGKKGTKSVPLKK